MTVASSGEGAIQLVDGSGESVWTSAAVVDILQPPPLSIADEAAVVTLGDESAYRLADGRAWADLADREGVSIDATTGVERFRVPFGGGTRFVHVGDSLVVEESTPRASTAYALSDGAPIALGGRVCRAGAHLLRVDGREASLLDPDDWAVLVGAETPLDFDSPRCGIYKDAVIVAETTGEDRKLAALETQTLSLRWALRLESPPPPSGSCRLGMSLPMAEALPRYLPLHAGDRLLVVDLDSGEVAARAAAIHAGRQCSPGLVIHDGRAYEIGESRIIAFTPDSLGTHRLDLAEQLEAAPSLAGRYAWVKTRAGVGRLRLPDLVPDAAFEWLTAKP